LYKTESLIKYEQIKQIDIGQATTTLKLVETATLDTMLFRYTMGGMASFTDGPFRMMITSKRTMENFIQELNIRGVNSQDISTTPGRFLILISVTLLSMCVAATAIYFTVLR
jgi:hypothetical protein